VENSVLHAFEGMEEGGLIVIEGREEGDFVVITVRDNGIGVSPETIDHILRSEASDTIGIPNVIKRIKLLYGQESGIRIFSDGSGTTTVIYLRKNP